MKRELQLGFPLLSDVDGAAIARYGLRDPAGDYARPAVLLLDADGQIRWAAFTENFRVRVRPEALLQAVRRLTPG